MVSKVTASGKKVAVGSLGKQDQLVLEMLGVQWGVVVI